MKRWLVLIGAAAVIVVTASIVFLLREAGPEGPQIVVGEIDDFPPGSITATVLDVLLTGPVPLVSETAEGNGVKVPIFLVNDPQTGLLALYARDPHRGCRVGLASELSSDIGMTLPREVAFFNPCHGETYDLLGGYLAGPSPRGLDRFAVSIIDGDVVVDVMAFQYGPPR